MPLTATVIGQLRLMASFNVVEKTTLPGVEKPQLRGISRAPDHIEVSEKKAHAALSPWSFAIARLSAGRSEKRAM